MKELTESQIKFIIENFLDPEKFIELVNSWHGKNNGIAFDDEFRCDGNEIGTPFIKVIHDEGS